MELLAVDVVIIQHVNVASELCRFRMLPCSKFCMCLSRVFLGRSTVADAD